MSGSMKVHLYEVARHSSPPIEQVLRQIIAQPLDRRMRSVGTNELRLENLHEPHTGTNDTPYWLLDFTNLRFRNGPGRANRNTPVTGFQMAPDDGFGEATAALYDPHKRVLVIQYNHHGPRATVINAYINGFDPNTTHDYQFRVKIDNSAASKLANKRILTKLSIKISPPDISADLRNGGTSLQKALAIADELEGGTIEITIAAGQAKNAKLNHSKTSKLIERLKKLMDDDGAVEKIEVSGRANPESRVELVDLIEEKIEADINNLVLGPDRRYTQDSRLIGLIRARNGWDNLL